MYQVIFFQFFASKKTENVPKSYYIYGGVGKFRTHGDPRHINLYTQKAESVFDSLTL